MISIEECATFARLAPDEMLMGAALSAHNRGLLASYKFTLERGTETVRDMIVADLRASSISGRVDKRRTRCWYCEASSPTTRTPDMFRANPQTRGA